MAGDRATGGARGGERSGAAGILGVLVAWVATIEAVGGRVCRANSAFLWQMTSDQMQPPGGEGRERGQMRAARADGGGGSPC